MTWKTKQDKLEMLEWFKSKVRKLEDSENSYNIENLYEDIRDEKNYIEGEE